MKKILSALVLLSMLTLCAPVFAGTHGTNGQVSGAQ